MPIKWLKAVAQGKFQSVSFADACFHTRVSCYYWFLCNSRTFFSEGILWLFRPP